MKVYVRFVIIATLVAGVASTLLRAEVVNSSAAGFTVRTTVHVSAPPEDVYDTLTSGVATWWSPDHTWSGDSGALSMDARAGGCFCERLASGGTVQLMQVVYAERGKMLRLSGGLGPLQATATIGMMSWALTRTDTGTRLEMTYALGGYLPGGFEKAAPAVDEVLAFVVERLAKRVAAQKR